MFGSRRRLAAAAGFWVLLLAAAAAISLIPGATAAAEAPVFSDGFESGNLSQWTASGGMTVQQQVTFDGAWAARATATGSPAYAYKRLGSPLTELYYDGHFTAISQGASNASIVRFRTPGAGLILSLLRRGSDGKLAYYNEVTGVTAVGPVVSAGVWHELEVHVLINGASSLVEVWLDGTRISALSRTDSLGTNPVGRVYIGDSASGRTFDYAYDDQVVSAADSTPPSTPTGLSVTAATLESISLRWNASSDNVGVLGYDLFVNGSSIGTTSGTNYAFTGLSCGTSYTLGVDAVDAAGNTSGQATVIASTGSCNGPPPDSQPPTMPTGLNVSGATPTAISLGWNASTDNVGVAGYDLFRNDTRVGTTTGTSYTFTGLDCGTSYTLGVDAFDAAGNVSGRATITAATSSCGGGLFYVSPTGSDSNPGTLSQPWRTIGRAMATLVAGQTAYLRAGTYVENTSGSCNAAYNKLIWTTSGTPTSPITISGYPGEENQVIVKTAVRLAGNYQRLTNVVADRNYTYQTFDLACTGGPNVQLYGDHDTVSGVEVRNSNASGVYTEGAAYATLTGNWIHDNGTHYNLDHGVYWFSGPNSVIANNIVQHNYANGIKIGPNAQSVLVSENTVNANGRSGITVCGDTSYTSNNNTVSDNILTWNGWSTGGGFGLRTYWETAGVGTGNQGIRNLMYANTNGDSWYPGGGMAETASILADPLFVDRAAGNFRTLANSPAVDSANSAYSMTRDYAGNTRPENAGPDIGAFER